MNTRTLRADEHSIDVSNADKVFYPEDGVTKGDIAVYYQQVASTLVRYAQDRPLTAERYPDGIAGQRIFQKNVPEYFPDWIPRVEVPKKSGGTTVHAVCDSSAILVFFADQACVTPHVWLSRVDELDRPDRLIFDLDPASNDLDALRSAARGVRELLAELGLTPFLMTTGSRGYHVLAPLRRAEGFDRVRLFAQQVAKLVATRYPNHMTVEQRKEDRGNRIFVDYLRNSYAQTAVAPYAVRAKRGAPVATPIRWDELDTVAPWDFDIHTVRERLRQVGDAWSELGSHARSLAEPQRRLARVTGWHE